MARTRGAPLSRFGRWLEEQMANCGMDLNELAAKAGLSQGYVSMLRNGKRVPSYSTILSLVSALGAYTQLDVALAAAGHETSPEVSSRARFALQQVAAYGRAAETDRQVVTAIASIGSASTIGKKLCAVLEGLAQLIPFDYGNIALVSPERDQIAVRAHKVHGTPAEEGTSPGVPPSWAVSRGITGWVARHARPRCVPFTKTEGQYLEHRPSTRSELAVPLVMEGTVLGVLNLESDEPRHFSIQHEETATKFAEYVAPLVALARELADLTAGVGVSRARLQGLADLQRALIGCADEDSFFLALATEIVKFPQFSVCLIREYDSVHRSLLLMSAKHREPGVRLALEEIGQPLKVDSSLAGRAVRDRRPILVHDIVDDERFHRRPWARALGLREMLSVPIPTPDASEIAGCIIVYTTGMSRLQEEDITVLEATADFASVCLSILREKLVFRLRLESARMLKTESLAPSTLDAVARLVCDCIGAQGASIFHADAGFLSLKGTTGIRGEPYYPRVSYQLGEGKTGWVASRGEPLRLIDRRDSIRADASAPKDTHKFEEDIAERPEVRRSFLAVPIPSGRDTIGVLRAVGKANDRPFTPQDQLFVEAIAQEIGAAWSSEKTRNMRIAVSSR